MTKTLIFTVSLFVVFTVWYIEDTRNPEPATESAGPIAEAPAVSGLAQPVAPRVDPFRPFLNALMQVESGGDCQAVGDGGRSHGPYQIGWAYWSDAGGGEGSYLTAVDDPDMCEYMMFKYWNRYCRKALSELDFETLARVHNGGPNGWKQASTNKNCQKVVEIYDSLK